jgi:3D (Asp-Asp-Asp) domain-containing protein
MIKLRYAIIGTLIPVLIIVNYASGVIDDLYDELRILKNNGYCECYELQEFDVTVTMYNPTRAQTDATPNELADGTKINIWKASKYRYAALSRDLLSRWGGPFDYGDYIIIEGAGKDSGIYQVRDTMNPKFTNRVDILKTKGSQQFKYTDATMYKYTKENHQIALGG